MKEHEMTPDNRKYATSHEWIQIVDGIATVGISDYAQEALGDITFVELPDVGDELEPGGDAAVVESVKAASDIYAPIGGTVCAVNEALEETPETINQDPYDAGWLFKLKDVDATQLASLLDATAYAATIEDA
jgi:glycine cleavage system H protein